MPVEQIRVGRDNFSYVIYCGREKKAAIVDPGTDASQALDFIASNGLELLFIINTHYHRDHTGDNDRVKIAFPDAEIISNEGGWLPSDADRRVVENEEIILGDVVMRFILTPGHTPGGICIMVNDEFLITGDTLFIDNCGRTDLHGGSNEQMYASLKKLAALPDELIVYAGHDYGSKPVDTLGNQKRANPTLAAASFEEFLKIP